MGQRSHAVPVGEIDIGTMLDEQRHDLLVPRSAVREQDRLEERGPVKLVHMVHVDVALVEQVAHDLDVAALRGRDQGDAAIAVGDGGVCAGLVRHAQDVEPALATASGAGAGRLQECDDLLLPTGPQGPDEIQYLLRGAVAAEHTAGPTAVSEIITKKGTPDAEGDRGELTRFSEGLGERFEKGAIEPLLPIRPTSKRNFQGVVERAKHRRREIGAFLRGLDLGRTETSHMDSHGEASLQSLMEWAARLENLAEADEPDQADYAQFHRGLDQLENTTEALIVDVELTLRRLRDRAKA